MLILKVSTGEQGESLKVGDAIIHVRKVGDQRAELTIDAPASVVVQRLDTRGNPVFPKPVEE